MCLVKVKGDSMQPLYQDGDYLIATRLLLRKPRAGDDIVFDHPQLGTLLKRVDRVDGNRLTARGLNSLSIESASLGELNLSELGRVRCVRVRLPR